MDSQDQKIIDAEKTYIDNLCGTGIWQDNNCGDAIAKYILGLRNQIGEYQAKEAGQDIKVTEPSSLALKPMILDPNPTWKEIALQAYGQMLVKMPDIQTWDKDMMNCRMKIIHLPEWEQGMTLIVEFTREQKK